MLPTLIFGGLVDFKEGLVGIKGDQNSCCMKGGPPAVAVLVRSSLTRGWKEDNLSDLLQFRKEAAAIADM